MGSGFIYNREMLGVWCHSLTPLSQILMSAGAKQPKGRSDRAGPLRGRDQEPWGHVYGCSGTALGDGGEGRSKGFQGCGSLAVGGAVLWNMGTLPPTQGSALWWGSPSLNVCIWPGHTQHAYIRVRSQEVGERKGQLVDSLEGKCATQRAKVWSGNVSRFPRAGP